jgi:CRISPR-associated protein Csm2
MGNIVLDFKNNAELLNKTAKEWADKIAVARPETKPTQIRNFYDYVLSLDEKAIKGEETFANILPFVKMLNSKVNYAKERKVANAEFVDMIGICVNQINTKEQLHIFKLFFEAVIGFSKKSDRGDR